MKALDTFRRVVGDIRAKKFKPIYILHGEEAYFIDRISKEIEDHALDEHERDFNQTILYGKDSQPDQIIEHVKRFPMMAERNLVILREAQGMRIDALEKLEPLFDKPVQSTVFVICYKHKKIDGRKKFVKLAKKHGELFESKVLYDNELPKWISGYIRHTGRTIGARETQLLADHLGTDLNRIVSEIEKLCVVTDKGEQISADIIQQQIGISKDHNIFELQNALGRKDKTRALAIAKYFGSTPNTHPLPVTVGVLNGYFTKVALVHANKDADRNTLPGILGCKPFFVNDYLAAARAYPMDKLTEIQGYLRTCDARSKGIDNSSLKDGDLLIDFVLRALS
jgi:DNA polymerase-3 subunit delta